MKVVDMQEESSESGFDETLYLMMSEANCEELNESIQQLENGMGIKMDLETLLL